MGYGYDYTADVDVSSRKRPLDEDRTMNGRGSKRSNAAGGPRKPFLKILIPNHVVGKLIGKGGSNINELESKYSASIQVAPNQEYYPGTEERVVTVSAEVPKIKEFCKYMITDVLNEKAPGQKYSKNLDFRMVITNIAVGLVMGKGGAQIKSIQESSHAKIHLAKPNESTVQGERLLKVCGSVENQVEASSQLIERMSADAFKMSTNIKYSGFGPGSSGGYEGVVYSNTNQPGFHPGNVYAIEDINSAAAVAAVAAAASTYNPTYNVPSFSYTHTYPTYASGAYATAAYGVPAYAAGPTYYEQKSSVKTTHMIQMEIPDHMVGAIVGKQGGTINEFTRTSGAKINFSGKDEYAAGTTNRILTIKGGRNAIHSAFMMVDQKVYEVEHESNGHHQYGRQ